MKQIEEPNLSHMGQATDWCRVHVQR